MSREGKFTDVQVQTSGDGGSIISKEAFHSSPSRLHISNIPFRFREHHLAMLFSNFGEVLDSTIIYNRMGSKGFGFVTMTRGEDAAEAFKMLNNSIVEGRVLQINLATPRTRYRDRRSYQQLSADLTRAESRLAKAMVEVKRIREELSLSGGGGGDHV